MVAKRVVEPVKIVWQAPCVRVGRGGFAPRNRVCAAGGLGRRNLGGRAVPAAPQVDAGELDQAALELAKR
jgi:hypothetical protein